MVAPGYFINRSRHSHLQNRTHRFLYLRPVSRNKTLENSGTTFYCIIILFTHNDFITEKMGMEQERSVDILMSKLRDKPSYVEDIKENPIQTLQKLSEEIKLSNPVIPASQDKFTYRIAVSVLSLVVLIVVGCVAVVFMIATINNAAEPKFPDILVAIGSTALGALAGLLAPVAQQTTPARQ